MNFEVTAFQMKACETAMSHMLKQKRHFSICTLRHVMDALGTHHLMSSRDMAALKALHCVDWGDMDKDLRRMVHDKCYEAMGVMIIEDAHGQTYAKAKPDHMGMLS